MLLTDPPADIDALRRWLFQALLGVSMIASMASAQFRTLYVIVHPLHLPVHVVLLIWGVLHPVFFLAGKGRGEYATRLAYCCGTAFMLGFTVSGAAMTVGGKLGALMASFEWLLFLALVFMNRTHFFLFSLLTAVSGLALGACYVAGGAPSESSRVLYVLFFAAFVTHWALVNFASLVIHRYHNQLLAVRDDLDMQKSVLEEEVRKRTAALDAQREELDRSERMRTLGQLAGGIAHDFNNQLAGIMGAADMLKNRLQGDSRCGRYADIIVRASARASELTSQLLAFARKGKYQSIPVDIHQVIGDVVSLLKHSIDKRVKIKMSLQASPSTTIGDPAQLESALLNVAINAGDAMPEGGELTFSTRIFECHERTRGGSVEGLSPGRYVEVQVADTGTGMRREVLDHIFEPFFTTKAEGQGTGMGLAAVYGTVKMHAGGVRVETEEHEGTSFFIYLPLWQLEAPPKQIEESAHPKAASPSVHVLVVDDETMVREFLKELLEELGYRVSLCEDGEEAVEFYRESWEDIDVVILDMVMPRMRGTDAFVALRQINPGVKVVVSSGYSIDKDAREAIDRGASAFIQKPFRMATLAEVIAEVLSRGE